MNDELGGGASRSTDPAAGSSAATDVSLREHIAALRADDREFVKSQLAALRSEIKIQREGDKEAIEKALASSKELAEKHNDLIRAGERKDETYATKGDVKRLDSWQARLTGAMLAVGAIGVANLVKLWLT